MAYHQAGQITGGGSALPVRKLLIRAFARLFSGRRHLPRCLALGLVLASASSGVLPLHGQIRARPNILFILSDDQAIDTIAAWDIWGARQAGVRTPHLDELVRNGTSFRHTYVQGSHTGAVCVASRSMLFTGLGLWATRRASETEFTELRAAGRSWPQRMQQAGYATYFAGKWHVAAPVESVFDAVRHVRPGMPESVDSAYWRPPAAGTDPWSPSDPALGGYWEGGQHWSEVLVDDAAELLQLAVQQPRPFFIWLAFNAPHDPRQAPREFVETYRRHPPPVPANFLPENPGHVAMGLGPTARDGLRDEVLAPFPRTESAIRVHRQEYYAAVSHLDAQIGRILALLKQSPAGDHTIVVFAADNGLAVGRHGLLGKQNMYEHSLRVPLIFAGPGVPAGQSIDTPIYLPDAMATILDLAGGDGRDLDFRSVRTLWEGKSHSARDSIYAAYLEDRQRAIIRDDMKLILYPTARQTLLFDLGNDPLELRDLADDPQTLAIQRRLFADLQAWQTRLDDPLDLTELYPQLAEKPAAQPLPPESGK